MWKKVSISDFKAIGEAREQLHQAIQLVAALARSYNKADPGDSFATLTWDEDLRGLISGPIANKGFKAYLRFEDLTIGIIGGKNSCSIDLEGLGMSDARTTIQTLVSEAGLDLAKLNFGLPYTIPDYPLSKGLGQFDLSYSEQFKELAKYYWNANEVLNNFQLKTKKTSSVLCWPHHFDLATLVTLIENEDPEEAKSIGVGFSPGDDNYNEPYYYLTPWPYPPTASLPNVQTLGHWHTHDWVGRVLTASELIKSIDQDGESRTFIEKGFDIIKTAMIRV